jgi:hypothetical protein
MLFRRLWGGQDPVAENRLPPMGLRCRPAHETTCEGLRASPSFRVNPTVTQSLHTELGLI